MHACVCVHVCILLHLNFLPSLCHPSGAHATQVDGLQAQNVDPQFNEGPGQTVTNFRVDDLKRQLSVERQASKDAEAENTHLLIAHEALKKEVAALKSSADAHASHVTDMQVALDLGGKQLDDTRQALAAARAELTAIRDELEGSHEALMQEKADRETSAEANCKALRVIEADVTSVQGLMVSMQLKYLVKLDRLLLALRQSRDKVAQDMAAASADGHGARGLEQEARKAHGNLDDFSHIRNHHDLSPKDQTAETPHAAGAEREVQKALESTVETMQCEVSALQAHLAGSFSRRATKLDSVMTWAKSRQEDLQSNLVAALAMAREQERFLEGSLEAAKSELHAAERDRAATCQKLTEGAGGVRMLIAALEEAKRDLAEAEQEVVHGGEDDTGRWRAMQARLLEADSLSHSLSRATADNSAFTAGLADLVRELVNATDFARVMGRRISASLHQSAADSRSPQDGKGGAYKENHVQQLEEMIDVQKVILVHTQQKLSDSTSEAARLRAALAALQTAPEPEDEEEEDSEANNTKGVYFSVRSSPHRSRPGTPQRQSDGSNDPEPLFGGRLQALVNAGNSSATLLRSALEEEVLKRYVYVYYWRTCKKRSTLYCYTCPVVLYLGQVS